MLSCEASFVQPYQSRFSYIAVDGLSDGDILDGLGGFRGDADLGAELLEIGDPQIGEFVVEERSRYPDDDFSSFLSYRHYEIRSPGRRARRDTAITANPMLRDDEPRAQVDEEPQSLTSIFY